LLQVGGFLRVLQFPPPVKLQPKPIPYFGNKIIYIILTSVAACGCEVAPSNFPRSPAVGCFPTFIVVVLFPLLAVSVMPPSSNLCSPLFFVCGTTAPS